MGSQFGSTVEYDDLDQGTPVWAVKPGPDAIASIPAVPGTTDVSEDFEGTLWTEIALDSGDWALATDEAHSPTHSYKSKDITSNESSSFTIQNNSFQEQISFWLMIDTEANFDFFRVFVDAVEVYSESGINDWHRVSIPTGFGYLVEFRYSKDSSGSTVQDACWVDDLVFGTLDTPEVPGSPAHPLVYTPLRLTGDDELLIAGEVTNANLDVALSSRASEATLSAFRTENDANLDAVNAKLDVHTVALAAANVSLDAIELDVDQINADVDVALSTRAAEATLSAFKTENDANLDAVNAELDAINAKFQDDASGAVRVHPKDPGIPGDVVDGSAWQMHSNPAANTQATVTQAAPGANKRLVVTTVRFSSGNTGLLGSVQNLTVEVVASGGSTLYQGRLIHAGAAGNFAQIALENRTLIGPANESIIVRFAAAGGANTFQSVAATGYIVDVS